MRSVAAVRLALIAILTALVAFGAGCTLVDVEMTSTPDEVHAGEPVTFDIKLTNRSACPLPETAAELVAFIPADTFFDELFGDLPNDLPPEVQAFFDELRVFFDGLCAGDEPEFPTPPMFATSTCGRGEDEIVCSLSGPLFSQSGEVASMTFGSDRMQCTVDGIGIRCDLHIKLPTAAAAGSGALSAIDTLTCLDDGDDDAFCFLGDDPENPDGLPGNGMATGRVILPARGSGFVRNVVFAFSLTDASNLGVCKGGPNAEAACTEDTDCAVVGGECEEGVCVGGGANDGQGCSETNQAVDCPGGTCQPCDDLARNGFLPIDCTMTYISPQGVPTMSRWALGALAALLLLSGSVLLHRRRRVA